MALKAKDIVKKGKAKSGTSSKSDALLKWIGQRRQNAKVAKKGKGQSDGDEE